MITAIALQIGSNLLAPYLGGDAQSLAKEYVERTNRNVLIYSDAVPAVGKVIIRPTKTPGLLSLGESNWIVQDSDHGQYFPPKTPSSNDPKTVEESVLALGCDSVYSDVLPQSYLDADPLLSMSRSMDGKIVDHLKGPGVNDLKQVIKGRFILDGVLPFGYTHQF